MSEEQENLSGFTISEYENPIELTAETIVDSISARSPVFPKEPPACWPPSNLRCPRLISAKRKL